MPFTFGEVIDFVTVAVLMSFGVVFLMMLIIAFLNELDKMVRGKGEGRMIWSWVVLLILFSSAVWLMVRYAVPRGGETCFF